ncbi:hypothetical protein O6H91_22G047000 [Diphasiastrum complanatum]|uniref:Uncharacterized protein n=1 Tax=Diphasiastrum complanatum TaxID=34168 RepID=A0ACC2AH07_DIPCM|nr:hypothetical protein O6H91_22G047000 [Diphasiastrum complanatum]
MTLATDWERSGAAYAGWVYHVGENSVGYRFCRARYLVIKGKYVAMYKRDPAQHPGEVLIITQVDLSLLLLPEPAATCKCIVHTIQESTSCHTCIDNAKESCPLLVIYEALPVSSFIAKVWCL